MVGWQKQDDKKDLRLRVILKVELQTGSFHALQHLVGWQKQDDKKDLRLLVILKVGWGFTPTKTIPPIPLYGWGLLNNGFVA